MLHHLGFAPYIGRKQVSNGKWTYHVEIDQFEGIEEHKRANGSRRRLVETPVEAFCLSLPTNHPEYSNLRYIRRNRPIAVLCSTLDKLGVKYDKDRYLVRVAEIEEGKSEVYDIEVSEVHSYVVDGVITHNTINLPHEATREDVARAFKLAYELGCKGITIYRYGSREEQVLNLVSEERRKETRGKVGPRPRPTVTRGATIRMLTGCGKLYVTINEDEQGLIEVFVNAGKSGGCVASQNEAIGRLISLGLRSGVDVQAIIKEMRGIKCPQPAWQDGELIQSCADAIGRAIELYLRQNGKWESDVQIKSVQFSSPPSRQAGSRPSSISPNEAGIPPECPECGGPLEFVEGCVVCRNCGYSKCD